MITERTRYAVSFFISAVSMCQNAHKFCKNRIKVLHMNFFQLLHYYNKCGIINYVEFSVTTRLPRRYARKRKVAAGMAGNFRGVCPILNRAKRDKGHSMCKTLTAQLASVLIGSLCPNRYVCSKISKIFEFFCQAKYETRGGV